MLSFERKLSRKPREVQASCTLTPLRHFYTKRDKKNTAGKLVVRRIQPCIGRAKVVCDVQAVKARNLSAFHVASQKHLNRLGVEI
jgi:hypothetical protein